MSAPSLSQGVSMVRPVWSRISSSRKAILSRTARAFMPVEEPVPSWRGRVVLPRAQQGFCSCGGAGPELEHGALIVDFLGSDAHLHAEELADLARQQRIVHTHGTSLRAATAKCATVRGFEQPTEGRRIQLDMFALKPCQGFSPRLGVLIHQAAEDFTPERG